MVGFGGQAGWGRMASRRVSVVLIPPPYPPQLIRVLSDQPFFEKLVAAAANYPVLDDPNAQMLRQVHMLRIRLLRIWLLCIRLPAGRSHGGLPEFDLISLLPILRFQITEARDASLAAAQRPSQPRAWHPFWSIYIRFSLALDYPFQATTHILPPPPNPPHPTRHHSRCLSPRCASLPIPPFAHVPSIHVR